MPTSTLITMRDSVVPVRRQIRLFEAIPDAEAFRVDGDHDAVVANAEQFVPTLLRAVPLGRRDGSTMSDEPAACASVARRRLRRAQRSCAAAVRSRRNLELAAARRARSAAPTRRPRRASCSPRPQRRVELDRPSASCAPPRPIADRLGNMKGALMKLGQMASYLDEGLPEPMRAALAELQSNAPPMSAELAAEVVERELGAPPEQLFVEWDPQPIASASIGQVHRAVVVDPTTGSSGPSP